MRRRVALLLATWIVSGCSSEPPPAVTGLVVITTGGSALEDGADDVVPTLDLRLPGLGGAPAAISLTLDGAVLPLVTSGRDLAVSVQPLPLGSAHRLELAIAGRGAERMEFRVVGPTGVMASAHGSGAGVAADVVFERAPDRRAVERALPGGAPAWADDEHLHLRWSAAPPSLDLPAGIGTAHGSHLAAAVHLDLHSLGTLRRVTVPAAPAVARPSTIAFSVGTDASRTSVAAHVEGLAELAPAGWRVASDGGLSGAPDPPAVSRAAAARVPVWPLVQNDPDDGGGIDALLADESASRRLIAGLADGVVTGGYGGVQLDLEGVPVHARDRLSSFVHGLAQALHARGRRLAVDVIPHRLDHLNRYSAAYDDPALAREADIMVLLAYDQHTAASDPGPVAGLDWQGEILDGTLPGLDPARTVLGLPLYARSWDGGHSRPAAYADAVADALDHDGAAVDYDFAAATPSVHWPAAGGGRGVTYFDDAESLARKVALAERRGLAGIAVWRLGFEDPAAWSLLSS